MKALSKTVLVAFLCATGLAHEEGDASLPKDEADDVSLEMLEQVRNGDEIKHQPTEAYDEPQFGPGYRPPQRPKEPLVNYGSNKAQCLFKSENNEWCFDTIPPMLSTGWEWSQTAGSDYYQVQIKPYMTTQINFKSTFSLKRLYTQTIELDVTKFKSYIWYQVLFSTKGQLCYGFGWQTDQIILNLKTSFEFQDVYKTIIEDMDDLEQSWYTKEAKWIDEWKPSQGRSQVTLRKWILSDAVDQAMGTIMGGLRKDESGCWKFAKWDQWAPWLPAAAQAGAAILEEAGLLPKGAGDIIVTE